MQAILALEDGRVFRGKGYGARLERTGEVVFNTSITGYQEIFTDPSYAGQIVCLTNPEIGNYGTNPDDEESAKPYIEGLIVREFSPCASNYRSQQVTDEYLERHRVPVLSDIDTRALVRHLRTRPYTPRTNGKAERFIQTLLREWAYVQPYRTSGARRRTLGSWLHYYNCHRAHRSLRGAAPITRLPAGYNLVGIHT